MTVETLDSNPNSEAQRKSSWDILREQSRIRSDQIKNHGGRTGFGHPDELAEHVVFMTTVFFNENPSKFKIDLVPVELRMLLNPVRYDDILYLAQLKYEKEYLPQHPDANPSIVGTIFDRLFPKTPQTSSLEVV